MQHQEAVQLICDGVDQITASQTWADLGCGAGTFTLALADCLISGQIYAIDTDPTGLSGLPEKVGNVTIQANEADFTHMTFPTELDGVIMANSLHYVKDQQPFLKEIVTHLKPAGRIILVEYDSESANQWVPFPISFSSAKELFNHLGMELTWLGVKPSMYQSGNIYSAVAEFPSA